MCGANRLAASQSRGTLDVPRHSDSTSEPVTLYFGLLLNIITYLPASTRSLTSVSLTFVCASVRPPATGRLYRPCRTGGGFAQFKVIRVRIGNGTTELLEPRSLVEDHPPTRWCCRPMRSPPRLGTPFLHQRHTQFVDGRPDAILAASLRVVRFPGTVCSCIEFSSSLGGLCSMHGVLWEELEC